MVQRKVKWPLVEADKSLTWQALQIVAVLLACTFRLEAEKWRRRGRKKGKSTEKTGHKSNLMAWACKKVGGGGGGARGRESELKVAAVGTYGTRCSCC